MNWFLLIGGGLVAVFAGVPTLAPNGGTILGLIVALYGAWRIARDDVRAGL